MALPAFRLRKIAYRRALFSAIGTIQQPRQENNTPTFDGKTGLKFMPNNLPAAWRNKAR
jgi:hypothetical protein